MNTQKAEGDQQAERGFRAVCCGAEGVQAKDGNACGRADLLGALVAWSLVACRQLNRRYSSESTHRKLPGVPFAMSCSTKSTATEKEWDRTGSGRMCFLRTP